MPVPFVATKPLDFRKQADSLAALDAVGRSGTAGGAITTGANVGGVSAVLPALAVPTSLMRPEPILVVR
jgi:hypothetical protein